MVYMQDETTEKKLSMIQETDFMESETTGDEDAAKMIKNNVCTK